MSEPDFMEIVNRRFGLRFSQPCNNPNVLECAYWDCQNANCCQIGSKDRRTTGTQVIRCPTPPAKDGEA